MQVKNVKFTIVSQCLLINERRITKSISLSAEHMVFHLFLKVNRKKAYINQRLYCGGVEIQFEIKRTKFA